MLLVQKFGGTSVGTPERILSVAKRIAEARARGDRLVVVVSAMGDTTDELIELAHKVSKEPPHREMDMLLTAGERISMALLSMALADQGVAAVSFTGSQSGIITTSSHRRARIQKILGDRIREELDSDKVVIVAGFQGVSPKKEITTLGRGGSDTTAVALAATLGAEECEIFTDVDGVYTADPRVVPEARLLKTVPHDHMVEMATRGAGVLHPRSVELAKQFGVRLRVLNSLKPGTTGTEIVPMRSDGKGMEEFRVTGVTADQGKILIEIELTRPTVLSSIWDRAGRASLAVVAPLFCDGKARFFADRDAIAEWKKHLSDLSGEGFITRFEIHEGIVPLSVVGDRFSQDGTALQIMLETLATCEILVTMGSASALGMTVGVPRQHAEDGVRALHKAFFEGTNSA